MPDRVVPDKVRVDAGEDHDLMAGERGIKLSSIQGEEGVETGGV